MNKIFKHIIEIALAISIILNLVVVVALSGYSAKFNNLEDRIYFLTNSINSLSNGVSNSNQPIKEQVINDIMTPTELAAYMKIDVQQIYASIIENPNSKFPKVNINGEVRFSKKAIDEYMLKQNNSN